MKANKIITFLLVASLGVSCSEDFFDVPTTQYLTAEAFEKAVETDPSKVTSAVNSIYNVLVQYDLMEAGRHDVFGYLAILHATDMMSEDISLYAWNRWFGIDYYHRNRIWENIAEGYRTRVVWGYFYKVIAGANDVLGITSADSDSPDILAARGQALALRAFSYFYLVQLYQHVYTVVHEDADLPGVPLYYAGNEEKESNTSRVSVKTILAQIEEDLTSAVANLNGWTRSSKNQIDYAVANGLLSRYYLLTEQWDKAIDAAQKARANYNIMSDSEIFDGFMNINNAEWLWGFDHNAETTTLYGSFFSHIANLSGGYAGLGYSPRLVDKRLYESIPETDARKRWFQNEDGTTETSLKPSDASSTWDLPYAPLKFGDDGAFTQDYIYMRASEFVLIEAEALAHQDKATEAAAVLKELLQKRDPAWNESRVTVDDVWLQRRIELWGEGFSTFDRKRLDKGIDRTYSGNNHYLDGIIAVPARDKRWIYLIPQTEILENPNISVADNNEL